MVRIYDEAFDDPTDTVSFKVSAPGTLRYQIDSTASYATAAAMDAAAGSAELTGSVAAPVGAGLEAIDVSGLASGAWYLHLVQNASGTDSTPVAVSFTKVGSTVVLGAVVNLTLTPNAATITRNVNVFAGTRSVTITPFAATISTAGANTEINANAGSLTLTPFGATIVIAREVAANAASLSLTANAAAITRDVNVLANARSLTLTEFAATIDTGGAFTPADLFAASEQGGWYDPSDLSTLWQDTAGTTPVTADGQAVARIDDKSGNGNHLTQATAANRPLYKTSGGLHWLEFDRANDFLQGSAISFSNWEFSAAFRPNLVTTYLAVFSQRNVSNSRGIILYAGNSSLLQHWSGNNTASFDTTTVGTLVNNSDYVGEGYFDGTTKSTALNGGTPVTATSISFTNATTNFRLGAGANEGAASFFFGIRIYGLVIVDAAKASDRADLRTWMGAKAGLVL